MMQTAVNGCLSMTSKLWLSLYYNEHTMAPSLLQCKVAIPGLWLLTYPHHPLTIPIY